MKTVLFVGLLPGLIAVSGWAQSSPVELTCRSQAKEVAAQAYSSCMTEARNSQVDEIRKQYEKDLEELKSKYDQELKKLGAAKTTAELPSAPSASITSSTMALPAKKAVRPTSSAKAPKAISQAKAKKSKAKASKSIAQRLPSKRTTTREAMPIQAPIYENQVVAAQQIPAPEVTYQSPASTESLEREALAADQIDIVEMPYIEE